MEHLSNDHSDHSNLHGNIDKLCRENGHPLLSSKESQLKFKNDPNFPVVNCFLWWMIKSPKTNTLACGSIEKTSSMLH